jgi:hypothetical protein
MNVNNSQIPIPILTSDPKSLAPWKKALTVTMQLAEVWNVVSGDEVKPFHVGDRKKRASSVMPESVIDTTLDTSVIENRKKEWRMWSLKENKAQALIKTTISPTMYFEIEKKNTAKEMWDTCISQFQLATVSNQRRINREIYGMRLRGNATPDKMVKHLDKFVRLMLEAEEVGLAITEPMRVSVTML